MAIKNLGTTLSVTPDGGSPVALGSITSATVEFVENERIDVTTLGNTSGYRDYLAGMNGVETLTFDAEWDCADFEELKDLVNVAVAPSWTLTLPSSGGVIAGDGWIKKLSITADGYESSVKFSCTIEGTAAAWTLT